MELSVNDGATTGTAAGLLGLEVNVCSDCSHVQVLSGPQIVGQWGCCSQVTRYYLIRTLTQLMEHFHFLIADVDRFIH